MNDQQQFQELLTAYANRDLTHEEQIRMLQMADTDEMRSTAVAEIQDLQDLLDQEQRLMQSVMQPAQASEEMDESYRRLARTANRSESELRAEMLRPVRILHGVGDATDFDASTGKGKILAGGTGRFGWGRLAAAAAIIIVGVLAICFARDDAPALTQGPVAGGELGDKTTPAIFINVRVTQENPEISWHDVVGARSYAAVIEGADGKTILRRSDSSKGSTLWKLTEAEYRLLKRQTGSLFLRILARDGLGLTVASSRDRQVRVR